MTLASIELVAEVRRFVVESFLYGTAEDLPSDDQSLLEAEIIDSTGVLELILFIEETYGIAVDETEITPENFDSVQGIAGYISTKRSPSPP
jgi:acyl carrier protein